MTVRPQVDGKLISVGFQEGQDVKRGDVLARIDPRTYQAQIRSGGGQEGAGRGAARQRPDRSRALHEARRDRTPSTPSRPTRRRRWSRRLEAQVQADQAAIDNAKAMLSYTTIVAPIDGRTGIRQVDEGNIVHASSATASS